MERNNKSIVAAFLIIVFVVYAVIQLTCNAVAPEPAPVESESESR